MSKHSPDDILKKTTAFEKMALYGDRKSFLRSLAQGFDADIERKYLSLDELGRPLTKGIPSPPKPNAMEFPAGQPLAPHTFDRVHGLRGDPNYEDLQPKNTTPSASFQSIPWQTQNMLSEIVSQLGLAPRIQIDGKIGPETQRALNAFKAQYFPKGSTISNDQLFKFIEETYKRDPEAFK